MATRETTSGGNALKFYAAIRLDMRKMEAIKQGGEVIGNRVRVRVKKNKVAPPFRGRSLTSCSIVGSPKRAVFWILALTAE